MLTEIASGNRRHYWLSTFGTPGSRWVYHRLLAEWETNGAGMHYARSGLRMTDLEGNTRWSMHV